MRNHGLGPPATSKVHQMFQHGQLLSIRQRKYREWVLSFLDLLLKMDAGDGDFTVKTLFPDGDDDVSAEIVAKESGVLAGLEELSALCKTQKIKFVPLGRDGDSFQSRKIVARLSGPVSKILQIERLSLDLLGRMSGIATLTRRLCQRAGSVPLAATRKTLWGPLDKKGVYVGGGLTHRLGLWQAILIKDNHLAALQNLDVGDPFLEAVTLANAALKKETPFLEIEVESIQDAQEVIEIFQKSDQKSGLALLLDNFSPKDILTVISILEKKKLRRKILIEVSGGITDKNLAGYVKTKPDLISLGMLTHSVRALDFSQRIRVQTRRDPR